MVNRKIRCRVVGIDDFSGGYEDFVDEEVTLFNRDLSRRNIRYI